MPEVSSAAPLSVDDVARRLSQLARFQRPRNAGSPDWLSRELTFGQLRILFLLRDHRSLTMSGLAEMLGVTPATVSGVVERIERTGLVTRRHRLDDRRVVEVALTDEGDRTLREMAGARLDAMRQTLEVLTPDELAEFDRLLGIIVARLDERVAR